MKTYIRCKACGYIMDESHLKDVCPACNLPKTVFEPYTKKISPQRKFLLDQHFHPIAVHFPQVFMALIVSMLSFSFLVAEPLRNEFLIVAKFSLIALPFSVFFGFITGLYDGNLRFKTVKTPILKSKILVGAVFQGLSCLMLWLYLTNGFTPSNLVALIALGLVSTGCAIYLGRVGSPMFDSFLPG